MNKQNKKAPLDTEVISKAASGVSDIAISNRRKSAESEIQQGPTKIQDKRSR